VWRQLLGRLLNAQDPEVAPQAAAAQQAAAALLGPVVQQQQQQQQQQQPQPSPQPQQQVPGLNLPPAAHSVGVAVNTEQLRLELTAVLGGFVGSMLLEQAVQAVMGVGVRWVTHIQQHAPGLTGTTPGSSRAAAAAAAEEEEEEEEEAEAAAAAAAAAAGAPHTGSKPDQLR
jgi:hypothetical protein